MANHPEDILAKKRGARRPLPSDARYEIVFEQRAPSEGSVARALDELKARVGRGGPGVRGRKVRSGPGGAKKLAVAFAELKRVAERGGAALGGALGDAYAVAAGAVLNRVERLEDLNAERRQRASRSPSHRSPPLRSPAQPSATGSPSEGTPAPGPPSRPHPSPAPKVKP